MMDTGASTGEISGHTKVFPSMILKVSADSGVRPSTLFQFANNGRTELLQAQMIISLYFIKVNEDNNVFMSRKTHRTPHSDHRRTL